MGLWVIDGVNTPLNHVPIFLILFALIAILEDGGHMARIAFILALPASDAPHDGVG